MSNLPAIKNTLNNPKVWESITQRLGDEQRSREFISSVLELAGAEPKLQECEPNNLIQECLKAASLKLPISKQLGFAYIIPYNQSKQINGQWKKVMTANFQPGYKGLLQLAIRSGQFKHLNADVIFKGEKAELDKVKGTFTITGEKKSDEIVGAFSYMELINGFEKGMVWSSGRCLEHASKYSKSYQYAEKTGKKDSLWHTDFGVMCIKTMLLQLFKYAPMSIEMQSAVEADSSDTNINNAPQEPDFSDANSGDIIDVDTEPEKKPESKPKADKKEETKKEPINQEPPNGNNSFFGEAAY